MLIIGAGGFAKQLCSSILMNKNAEELVFFDSFTTNNQFLGTYQILHTNEDALAYLQKDNRFLLGTGKPALRAKIAKEFINLGGKLTTHISNHALISDHVIDIKEGATILPQVLIEPSVTIGRGVLLNTNAFIAHDVTIGDFCEISPSVQLLGGCSIGEGSFIGAGAVILPGVSVGNNSIVGAGALVNKDVAANKTVVGIPAK